jgi:hypothetical protein
MSKNTSKKNEEKLRIYLSKTNDTKPGNSKDKKPVTGAQAGKELLPRTGK